VLGLAEPEGHAVQHPQFGAGALDQRIGQVVHHGCLDAGDVLPGFAPELDEGTDATALDPDEPFVEHGEGEHPLGPDRDAELLFHQIGAVGTLDSIRSYDTASSADQDGNLVDGAGRGMVTPEIVDQSVSADRLAVMESQDLDEGPQLASA
jgi:hypothetical protein